MADKKTQPPPAEVPRGSIGTRILIQGLAVIFIVIAVNVIGFEYYKRWDFSRSQSFTLSVQTRNALKQLTKPAKITVFFSRTQLSLGSLLYPDVQGLLQELQFSARERLDVEYVDPSRDQARAREVMAAYKLADADNALILDYDGRSKVIAVADMGDWDTSGIAAGDTPRLVAFRGEQAIVGALLGLIDPAVRKLYFLQGHGEPPVAGASPTGLFLDMVRRQNIGVAGLNLVASDQLPQDLSAIAVVSPKFDLSDAEIGILRRYWTNRGRLLILLDPDVPTPHLGAFLKELCIDPLDQRILRTLDLPLVHKVGIIRDVAAHFLPGSEVTKRLIGVNGLFPTAVQPLQLDLPRAEREGIELRPLAVAAQGYWGETAYAPDPQKGVAFDTGVDSGPPIYMAASVELGGPKDERLELQAPKLIAVGNADFALDRWLGGQNANAANLDFLASSVNWLVDRARLTGIVPKSKQYFSLNLTDVQLGGIALYTMVVIPGAVALLGFFVWWRRRS